MLLNRPLLSAALLMAGSLNAPAAAQDVPAPPPAGVKPVPRRTVPGESPLSPPSQQPVQKASPEAELPSEGPGEALPKIPENAIRLNQEDPRSRQVEQPAAAPPPAASAEPLTQLPQAATQPLQVSRRPPKPKGPVYYFPVDAYGFPANVTTPPPMHLPNSPFVEELSVAGDHGRYTYYSYRRPWYTPGQLSANVTIVW